MGNGGIAPHVLNLGTKWRGVVSFMPQLLYPWGILHLIIYVTM